MESSPPPPSASFLFLRGCFDAESTSLGRSVGVPLLLFLFLMYRCSEREQPMGDLVLGTSLMGMEEEEEEEGSHIDRLCSRKMATEEEGVQ